MAFQLLQIKTKMAGQGHESLRLAALTTGLNSWISDMGINGENDKEILPLTLDRFASKSVSSKFPPKRGHSKTTIVLEND